MAGFLKRWSISGAERRLGPLMAPGEHIMDYEIADVRRNDGPFGVRPVIVSNRAVWFSARDRSAVRIPYASVVDLRSPRAGSVFIATAPRPGVTYSYLVHPAGKPKMDLYGHIAAQMKQLERHSVKVEVSDTQWVHAVVRMMGEQSVLGWYFVPLGQGEAPDLRTPAVQERLHSELAATSAEYGITVQDGLDYTIPVLYKD